MPKYSIIIPTKDRENNLACCLEALTHQTLPKEEWEVIITDESEKVPWRALEVYKSELNLIYLLGPCLTGNPGSAKNWAVRNAKGEAVIFVDSDVALNKEALGVYDELHTKYPNFIILGRYDLLMPMDVTPDDIAERFDEVVSNQLPILYPPEPGPMPGKDARWNSEKTPKEESVEGFALAMFGGNTLVPKALFELSGGYDPRVVGHGGEDCELGWTMEEIGAKALLTERAMGWHIYHNRPQEQNEIDVRKNIEYIDRKHGIGPDGQRKVPLE